MYAERRVLAVVPARGGSKGIPLKNLQPLGGQPLVALAGQVISEVPEIDRACVSTDHPEIAAVAQQAGLEAPFLRPEELAGDRVGDVEVLQHALDQMEGVAGHPFDIILMVQPTSPLRRAQDLVNALTKLVDEDWDAVWSVSETDSKNHPLKQLCVEAERLGYYDAAGAKVIARQQLTPLYHRNGAVYAVTRECLMERQTLMGPRTGALVIERPMISIDTPFDIEFAEWLSARA